MTGVMEQIWNEGYEKGFKIGFKQGFKIGFEQGFKIGFEQSNVEIVTKMSDSGLSVEQIAQATGLSAEKVSEIVKSIKN